MNVFQNLVGVYQNESYVGDVQCLENVIFDTPVIVSVAKGGRYVLLSPAFPFLMT